MPRSVKTALAVLTDRVPVEIPHFFRPRRKFIRMKYDEYRANGWFVGSGVVESACKTVIGHRFKQSGMIWSLKGAKALLPLRTLHKSNRLEEFFQHLVKGLRQGDCAA